MTDGEPDFTMGDLLQQLAEEYGLSAEGAADEEGVYTTTELCKIFGMKRNRIMEILHREYDNGRIEVVRKRVSDLGGYRKQLVPAYKLKGEGNGKD